MYAGQVVESGPAEVVTDHPAHPYTQLLLSAAPDPERTTPPVLRGRGAPPSLVTPPAGLPLPPALPARHGDLRRADPAHAPRAASEETLTRMSPQAACWLHSPRERPSPEKDLREGGEMSPDTA